MELISHHQPEGFRKGQKETPHVRPPPRILLSGPSWLNKACTTRKDSKSEWLAKDNPETNPITIKPKTVSHKPRGRAVLLGSLTLLLSTQVPFPNKISCFVSTCVSSDNSFPSVRQEPGFRPWNGSPFLQQSHWQALVLGNKWLLSLSNLHLFDDYCLNIFTFLLAIFISSFI